MNEKPEALRLADELEVISVWNGGGVKNRKAAAELRRLHAENERLREALALAERLAAGRLAMVEQLTGEVDTLRRENERLREMLRDTTVNLGAAVSLLKNGGKKTAASDKMFEQMLVDYTNSFERGRAALRREET